jgi:hypothetical protein
MATITSKAVTGNLSTGANWVGDTAPTTNDIIVIVSGADITVDIDIILGSNISGVGVAATINGASTSSYGILRVASGVTLTLAGYDTSSNAAFLSNRYGKFIPASGSTVLIDGAGDFTTCGLSNGHFIADGVTLGIPAANITWSNQAGSTVLSSVSGSVWEPADDIYLLKLVNSTTKDPGPISNNAGDGLGALGDTSFSITAGTQLTNEVANYAAISSNGDYYINYPQGTLFYKSASVSLTLTYTFKYGTWNASGIVATADTDDSSVVVDNCTINYWGSQHANSSEYLGAAFVTRRKSALGVGHDSRLLQFTGNTFNYCARTLVLYNITADADHLAQVTGNHFLHGRYNQANNDVNGVFSCGYTGYVKIDQNEFETNAYLFSVTGRSPNPGMQFTNNTGIAIVYPLPGGAIASLCQGNVMDGLNATIVDSRTITVAGTSGNVNQYLDNEFAHVNRAVFLQSFMLVVRNKFRVTRSDGIVWKQVGGYFSGLVVTDNLITESLNGAYYGNDNGGGFSLGLNQTQWIDDVTLANNTFDGNSNGINLGYNEDSIILGTRLKIVNNIVSNSNTGLYRYSGNANNVYKLALTRCDYNLLYNNTNSNVVQATFMQSAVEYNTATRNLDGVLLSQPTYSLPMSSGKTLQLAAFGTEGTDKALNLSWGGGTPVDLVLSQGTASSGTTSTLVDSAKSWTTNAYRACYVKIISGTGAGQIAMIRSNTGTALTVYANNAAGTWTAPSSDSVYLIIDSEVQLLDSGASDGIQAGIYLPDLDLTNGTISDTGITIETHAVTSNPSFTGTGDYSLQSGSPAIDAGTSEDGSTVDIVGQDRPFGSEFDIGCYEYAPPTTTSLEFPTIQFAI